MKTKYLIIGNSAGGIGAAEAIRGVDKNGTMVIVSDEPYPTYSRPLISEYLAKICSLEKMLFRPADFYEKNNISTLLGRKVKRLNINEHTTELDGGEKIFWEKLLLATGGLPIIPQIKGIGNKGVFTFITLDDAKAIDRHLKGVDRAVVIGGGLIGISVTEALVKRKVKVTIVEMKDRLLNTILDEEASVLAEETISQAGVNIVTAHTVAEINRSSAKEGTINCVTLDDGSTIPCSLVIVAIGVAPRTELVPGTGIKVNRGIVVDRHMATSHPDVYACGDATEAYDFAYGENRLTPIWPNAYLGGQIAGYNIAGRLTEYQGWTAMNSLTYFGLDIISAGMVNPPDNGYEVLSQKSGSIYRKVVLKDGTVVGMIFVGDIEKSGIVFTLMRKRVNVSDFKSALVADDFGLISFPDELCQQWLKVLSPELVPAGVSSSQPDEAVMGE